MYFCSFFGKTAENKKAHNDVKLTTKPSRATQLASKPTVKRWKTYEAKLAAFLMRKPRVVLDKPRYVGFTILEDSKLILDKFHYDFILPTFGGDIDARKVKVCHLDTGKAPCFLNFVHGGLYRILHV